MSAASATSSFTRATNPSRPPPCVRTTDAATTDAGASAATTPATAAADGDGDPSAVAAIATPRMFAAPYSAIAPATR
eukprot:31383-Pelagococcus_subviridis.AAC.17